MFIRMAHRFVTSDSSLRYRLRGLILVAWYHRIGGLSTAFGKSERFIQPKYNRSALSGVLAAFAARLADADVLAQEKVDILREGTVRLLGIKADFLDDILIQRDTDFLFQRTHKPSPH